MNSLRTPFSRFMADALSRAVKLGAAPAFTPDELYRIPTPDGSAIALGRYRAVGGRRYADPVILCHGLGANRFIVDLDETYSLARYLARQGFDAWVLELRGRGLSGPAADATFDDQAEHDVGTAIRTVLDTGAERVLWVGHSKGGLLLYAHLARNPEAKVRAGVVVGSPVTFAVQPGLKRFVRTIGPLLKLPVIPASRLGALAMLGMPPGPITPYLLREENMEPEVVRRAMSSIASDIPGGVARQFADWVTTGRFASADGRLDYREAMRAIRTPLLLIAGSQDLLAPPLAVARAKELVRGPVKVVVAGRGHGFADDYGHNDLLVGRRAPHEIFPLIGSYLAAQATEAGRTPATAAAS